MAIISTNSKNNTEELEANDPLSTKGSLIMRDLEGKIFYWNSSAEKHYGLSHQHAIGNVSHNILNTVFPEPLDIINHELMSRGIWKGELIHTKADGSRVKVKSTWHLYRDNNGTLCTVLEINDDFFPVKAENAHLSSSKVLSRLRSLIFSLYARRKWILVPALLAAILIYFFLRNGGSNHQIFFFEDAAHLIEE